MTGPKGTTAPWGRLRSPACDLTLSGPARLPAGGGAPPVPGRVLLVDDDVTVVDIVRSY